MLPTTTDIRDAARTIEGKARITPLMESPLLNESLGGRLLIKPEMLQFTGSFKFRGAYNRISAIPMTDREGGVVAFSSGNHAQGVAMAARMLNIPAAIIMPSDAPEIKIFNTRAYGAEIVLYDRYTESREDIGTQMMKERGATLVRPYDDPMIIAGQGTIGLELVEQSKVLEAELDAVLGPCGGGGLMSGTALAMEADSPRTEIYGVEPEGFDDTVRSLQSGTLQSNTPGKHSICDALLAPGPGELTFALNHRLLSGGFTVTDAETKRAMKTAFEHFKVVTEPGGAVALAAILSGYFDIKGKTAAIILSGGNVDANLFIDCMA